MDEGMLLLMLTCLASIITIGFCENVVVSSSVCERKYELEKGDELVFSYWGSNIPNPCKIEIERDRSEFGVELCAKIKEDGGLCSGVDVEYHRSLYTAYPDKELSCHSYDTTDEFCVNFDLFVVLKTTSFGSSSNGSPLKIKVYLKEDEDFAAIPEMVKTSVYIVIGVVVSCVILMIIVVVVIIICCCRRRTSSGTVYRSPHNAAATTTTQASYPVPQQPYQPQAGYQPPPQGGYQPGPYPQPAGYPPAQPAGYPPAQGGYPPAPQAGYQPPQQPAGYPPAPQQGYAGHQASAAPPSQQAAPLPDKQAMASAPPMSEVYPMQQMAPPPYPGN